MISPATNMFHPQGQPGANIFHPQGAQQQPKPASPMNTLFHPQSQNLGQISSPAAPKIAPQVAPQQPKPPAISNSVSGGITNPGGGGNQQPIQGSGDLQTQGQTNNTIPYPYNKYINQELQSGWNLAQQPLPIYGAPRIAPITAQEQQGLNGIASLQNGYQPYLNSAQQSIQNAPQSFTPQQWNTQTSQQYMDPYAKDVVQNQQDMALHNAQIANQQLMGNAAQQGAFGGSRQGVMQSENARNLGILQNQIANQGLSQAYQQGENTFNTANQTGLNAAQYGTQSQLAKGAAMGGLGSMSQQLGLGASNANIAAGQIGQNQTQNSLNLAYGDFLNQRQYPQNQLSAFNSLMSGSYPGTYNQQQNAVAPNQAQNYLGLGIAGLGAITSPLSSGGSSILGDIGSFISGL